MKSKTGILFGIVLLLAVIAGVTWAIRSRQPPEVSAMRELTSRMLDPGLELKERRLVGEKMRELKERIPAHRRDEVYREMGQQYRRQLSEHFRRFAALPAEQRNQFLDRDIEMKQMSSHGTDRRPDRAKKQFKFASMSAEQLELWKREKLDHTSAEDRAYMIEYSKALKHRMEERGFMSWDQDK